MKIIFSSVLILFCSVLFAQDLPNQISIGYFGNVINEQGARLGVTLYSKQWDQSVGKEDKLSNRSRRLFVQPQMVYFSRPLFYSNFQLGPEIGIRQQNSRRKTYTAVSIGANYLARMEVVAFTVDFKGEVTSKDHETWDYFLPTASIEVGKDIAEGMGWYGRFTYGYRMPFQESQETSGQPSIEFGIKLPFRLKANSKTAENE